MLGNCVAQNINVTAPFSTSSSSNGGGTSLGFNFARGSNRQSSTTTPSLTTQNGSGGSLFSGELRPFVTGVVPVVGGQGGNFAPSSNFVELVKPDNGVTRALQTGQLNLGQSLLDHDFQPSGPLNYSSSQSTAANGDSSVSAIKAERERRIAAQNQLISGIVESGHMLEQEGQFVLARIKYREALKLTNDKQVKDQINALIKRTRLKK